MEPRFVLPPHPNTHMRIRREDLPMYESMGKYIAQRKFNGTHVVIWIYQTEVCLWDRRGIPLTLYRLTPHMKECLLKITRNPSKETVLAGELLHTKAKSKITNSQEATDTIVLFDVLMSDSKYLNSITQLERIKYLTHIAGNPTRLEGPKFPGATQRAYIVSEIGESHLWLAETFENDFQYHYDECCTDQLDKNGNDKYREIEGLVLRQKDVKMRIKNRGVGDVDWLIRCRKRNERMYSF